MNEKETRKKVTATYRLRAAMSEHGRVDEGLVIRLFVSLSRLCFAIKDQSFSEWECLNDLGMLERGFLVKHDGFQCHFQGQVGRLLFLHPEGAGGGGFHRHGLLLGLALCLLFLSHCGNWRDLNLEMM